VVGHRCKNCMWYDSQHESLGKDQPLHGYCRKHKPIALIINGKYYGAWPIVDQNDFCGEFRGEN
jgi:hypothetical protein